MPISVPLQEPELYKLLKTISATYDAIDGTMRNADNKAENIIANGKLNGKIIDNFLKEHNGGK